MKCISGWNKICNRAIQRDISKRLTLAVLEINQNSRNNKEHHRDKELVVWTAEKPDSDVKYLALFNISDDERDVKFNVKDILKKESFIVRDLWTKTDVRSANGYIQQRINAHGAALFKII